MRGLFRRIKLIKWCCMKYLLPAALVLVSLGIAGYFVYMATNRTITQLEGTLLQFFILAAGLAGSFWFGRQSAMRAAREIIRPHARSAFRRLVSLYSSLARVAETVESAELSESVVDYRIALARVDATVKGQIEMADDALEDWRDIALEDVDELWQRHLLSENQENEGQENE